jgi:hypothetical protein
VLLVGLSAGWLWFGNAGAGLLGLWLWSGHWRDWCGGVRPFTLCLDDLRYARVGTHRVLCFTRGWQVHEVFADELDADAYAALRRRLKAWFRTSGEQARGLSGGPARRRL